MSNSKEITGLKRQKKYDDFDIKNAEELIRSVGIPSQPKVIFNLYREMRKEQVDFRNVSGIVREDAGLSAKLIKIANSPFFNVKQVNSVDQALAIMGIKNFQKVVLATSMQDALKGTVSKSTFNKFWYHSMLVARLSEMTARKSGCVSEDDSYLMGLFHDCALPLMAKKFNDYYVIWERSLGKDHDTTFQEDELYKTNHCVVSYLMARSWHLPENVCLAVLFHHTDDLTIVPVNESRKLLSNLLLAECITLSLTSANECEFVSGPEPADFLRKYENDPAGRTFWNGVLDELKLSSHDVTVLQDDAYDIITDLKI